MCALYANVLISKAGISPIVNYTKKDIRDQSFLDFQEIRPAPDMLNPDNEKCPSGDRNYAYNAIQTFITARMAKEHPDLQLFWVMPGSSVKALRDLRTDFIDESSVNELVEDGRKYMYNYTTTGHFTWPAWRKDNWGCQTIGFNFVRESMECASFCTANSYPKQVILDMSMHHPRMDITQITVRVNPTSISITDAYLDRNGIQYTYSDGICRDIHFLSNLKETISGDIYQMLESQADRCIRESFRGRGYLS